MNKMYDNETWTIGEDLSVNRYGFGAMRITGKGVWGAPANEDEAIRVLKKAIDLGVNFMTLLTAMGRMFLRN